MIPRSMKRKDDRIIIHFDYDCFYASVFEQENPSLKHRPLAVQQKQIVVTCNYEARRRGLHKLQLIKDAKRICPDVVIVLGEDLTRFRDASKALYGFLQAFSWSRKVERLGFDEVFMDMTDVVAYNIKLLNTTNLTNSFFCLSKEDPTVGFPFDAGRLAGHAWDEPGNIQPREKDVGQDPLLLRLVLGSHLAYYLRIQLEEQKGYTSTVGISTSKLLSKLVGNVNKPHAQTTLLPPYSVDDGQPSNVTAFIDGHDIGKIPNIGFKMAQKLREYILQRPAEAIEGVSYERSKEKVTVHDVRNWPDMSAALLEKILGGPGMPHSVGFRTWSLLHGIDETEVGQAKEIPRQISLEDSYVRLDTFNDVQRELAMLSKSLIKRMRLDLTEEDDAESNQGRDTDPNVSKSSSKRRWLAHPKILRLSTRPRPPPNQDGSRARASNRISRSAPLPTFLFSLSESIDKLSEKLVSECLIPLFRRLHPEKSGWDLSLVNIAVTNMAEAAGSTKLANGRDIGKMFRNQEDHLKEWKVEDVDVAPNLGFPNVSHGAQISLAVRSDSSKEVGSEDLIPLSQSSQASYFQGGWNDEDNDTHHALESSCPFCEARMPSFAIPAHLRFHEIED